MYARVARWEGAEADGLRASAEDIKSREGEGPPPGVPAKGFLLLIDPDSGRSLGISLYDTEEDLRKGDEALNAMSPGREDVGQRTSVESYEVAVEFRI